MHTTKIPRLHLNLQTDNTEFVNNPRRVYFLVRSGSGADHVVHAVEEDRVHADGHFHQEHLAPAMVKQIDASGTALGHCVSPFAQFAPGADIRWNELPRPHGSTRASSRNAKRAT